MNIKPSLQTRTRFNDYIENISFGHLRHDFAQVNMRHAASTIWAIIQLSARFSFITGFGGPDDREEVTPLASLVSSLSEDVEGAEGEVNNSACRMLTPWEQLLRETLAEVDLCVRGGQVGSDYHLHLLDQAMEELITAAAAECPSSHQRFYDYFLRDMFGSYHARYVWLKAQRVEMVTGRSTPAKGMPSDSLKLPQWITENVLFELDESRIIDFRVLNGDVQKEHWNDLSLFAKIAILVRDSLSDPLVDKPFDKLVGTLDQFFTLFLAQRMVANEAEIRGITHKPIAGTPEDHLRDQLGTAPLDTAQTPVARSLKSLQERFGPGLAMEGEGDRPIQAPDGYDWLISDIDQEMVRPSSPHPKVVHAAEQANLQSVMRNLIRGYTRNGKLGAEALEPNLFISQTVKYFLGNPPPEAGSIFGENQHVEHKPTLLRGGEEPSDPAAKQLLSVEEQRKANREAEVTELLYAALPGDPVAEGFQEKFNALREQVLAEASEKGVTARRGLSDLVDRAVALYGTGFKIPRELTQQEVAALKPVLRSFDAVLKWGRDEYPVYGLVDGEEWLVGSDLYTHSGTPVNLSGAIPGKCTEDGMSNFGGTLESLTGEWLHEQVVFGLPGAVNVNGVGVQYLFQLPELDPVASYTNKGRELRDSGKLEGGILHFTGDTANLGELGTFHLFTVAPDARGYILGGEISHLEDKPFDLLKCMVPTGVHAYSPVTEQMYGKVIVPGDIIGVPHDMVGNQYALALDCYTGNGVTRNELSDHVMQHELAGHMSLETIGHLVEGIIKNVGGLDKDRAVIIAETERLVKVLHEDYVANDMPTDGSGMTVWLRNFIRGCYVTRDLSSQQQDDLFHHLYLHKGISTILNVDEQAFVERAKKWMDLRHLPYAESADAYVEAAGTKMLTEAVDQLDRGRMFRPEVAIEYELVPAVTRRGMPDWQHAGHIYNLYSLKEGGEYVLFEPLFDSVGREIDMSFMVPVILDEKHQPSVGEAGMGFLEAFSKTGNLLGKGVLALIGKPKEDLVGDVDYCTLYVKRERKQAQ